MKTINAGSYHVFFENKSFAQLNKLLKTKKYEQIYLLCDENTMRKCMPILVTACPTLQDAEIIELESGEQSKNLEIVTLIWQTLLEGNASRKSLLINLGGGVVSDIGGFTASTYKRGISFINVPTTLLAMADASLGGKTGIDFNGIKNSVGTFAQPDGVFVFPLFLNTLDLRQFKSGMAEIHKVALASQKTFWNKLPKSKIEDAIYQSIVLKNKIVLKDPFESGLRKILNFGHTLGHAIEALALQNGGDLLHGEAVVVGMIMESHLSFQKKLISKHDFLAIVKSLRAEFEMPTFTNLSLQDLLPYLLNDKKNSGNTISFSLINGIGTCKTDVVCSLTQITKSIAFYTQVNHA